MRAPTPKTVTELVCTGIVIEVGPPGTGHQRAFALALESVAGTLPGEWGVMPLSRYTNDFHVSPWSGRSIPIGRSWDLCEKLASHRDVRSAEPAFRFPGLEPPPELLTPYEVRAASLKPDGEPLPCAKDNPLWSLEATRIDHAWQMPFPPQGKGKRYGARIKNPVPGTLSTLWPTANKWRHHVQKNSFFTSITLRDLSSIQRR